jgi:deazaflavin-dependent oxidoreductase (nitroreductase family)
MGVPLFGQEHVDRYRETDGEEGHDWQGTTVLLLTTAGRNAGAKRTTPLIYQHHGDDLVVVASNGGGKPPGWFLNLHNDPIVAVQVKAETHTTRARVATAEEKPELWRIMTAAGTPYDEFQATANREIPVVILSRRRWRPSNAEGRMHIQRGWQCSRRACAAAGARRWPTSRRWRRPAPNDDFRVARRSIPQTPREGGRYAREGRNK